MVIKINNDLEKKLIRIAVRGKIGKEQMLEKILIGFIDRYEAQHGPIMLRTGKKELSMTWRMYDIYKEIYAQIHNTPYSVTKQEEKIDCKSIENIQKKITGIASAREGATVIAVNDSDIIDAFRFFLTKMPDWWKKNAFHLKVLNSKFDQILKTIDHGKQRGKDALDDFIGSLSTIADR